MDSSIDYELSSFFIGAVGLAVCYDKSPSFRYKLKFVVYIVTFSTVCLFMITFCLVRPKNVKNTMMGIPYVGWINKLLGIQWVVSGSKILERDFPCVVVCNHQSILDVLAVIELWPTMRKCACIVKQEMLYAFPFGITAWLCGTIFINRKNSGQSQSTISSSAEKIQRDKTKMWIFPEGTRTKGRDLLRFKKGAFHIAMSHKLPIVPVVISPYNFIDDDAKTFDCGTMKIKVLDPINTTDLVYPMDVTHLTQQCHQVMNEEFQKMQTGKKSVFYKK